MKKKLIIFLLSLVLINTNQTKVKAEEIIQGKKTEWSKITIDENNIFRNYETNNGALKYHQNGINIIKYDNNVAYCLELEKTIVQDKTVLTSGNTTENISKNSLTDLIPETSIITLNQKQYKTIDIISLLTYYGTKNYNTNNNEKEKNSYYLAIQKIIWEILSNAGIYPTNQEERIKGNISFTTRALNETTDKLDNINDIIFNTSDIEDNILSTVLQYFEKPSLINIKETKNFKKNDDENYYFSIDYTEENQSDFFNNYNFSENSECKINVQDKTVDCIDLNNDNKVTMKLTKGKQQNNMNYLVVNDSHKNENQKIVIADDTPLSTIDHSINLIVPEIKEEKIEENPKTSDTSIILIITICLCSLISAIIIYIKKINLIKNNTI